MLRNQKAPWGVTDRDFLQKRTIAKDYDGFEYLMHFEHTEHPNKPVYKDMIRAHTIISGYTISPGEDPNSTKITIVAHTDVKVLSFFVLKPIGLYSSGFGQLEYTESP